MPFLKKTFLTSLILLIATNPAFAFMGIGKEKDVYQEELAKHRKTYQGIEGKKHKKEAVLKEPMGPPQPAIVAPAPAELESPVINLNQELIKEGNQSSYVESESSSTKKYLEKNKEQKSGAQLEKVDKKTGKSQDSKSSNKQSKKSIEEARKQLKENEKKALDFVFPSIDTSKEELSRENFFSKTEKEQLLELWRATLARNRTIQFIIKSLSANSDDLEKNNAVMQALSKALFVPFYAIAAVSNNSLINGGTAVGARVIGDIVDAQTGAQDRNREITKTDLIVLFMLVDEVANRMRTSYYAYKEARIEKKLLEFELQAARIDAAEAFQKNQQSSIFFTRMVVRDLERKTRSNKLNFASNRRTLVELAGDEAVNSVDLLIDLETEEMMQDVLGI